MIEFIFWLFEQVSCYCDVGYWIDQLLMYILDVQMVVQFDVMVIVCGLCCFSYVDLDWLLCYFVVCLVVQGLGYGDMVLV